MNIKAWIAITFIGIVAIIIQFAMPDLVPGILENLIAQDNSNFVGVDAFLSATLIVWYVGGYLMLIAGIIGTAISMGHSK